MCVFDLFTVPDDVFAQNYIWKGSYNFKGRKQPMTLTVTSFNASTGRVNATLSNSNMELLLSGIMLKNSKQCLHAFTSIISSFLLMFFILWNICYILKTFIIYSEIRLSDFLINTWILLHKGKTDSEISSLMNILMSLEWDIMKLKRTFDLNN